MKIGQHLHEVPVRQLAQPYLRQPAHARRKGLLQGEGKYAGRVPAETLHAVGFEQRRPSCGRGADAAVLHSESDERDFRG